MKRAIFFLAVFTIIFSGAISASADSLARDAMMTYTGHDAFTKLTSMERQACVDWLVHGGEMSEKCCKAVKKLVAYAPDAVTPEQRQALIAEASGYSDTATSPEYSPARTETPPQIVKQEDNTGKYIAIGVLGVIAGMVIHNNVGGSSSGSSCRPTPRYCPPRVHIPPRIDRRPPRVSCPPARHPQPPRPVYRPIDRRPTNCNSRPRGNSQTNRRPRGK